MAQQRRRSTRRRAIGLAAAAIALVVPGVTVAQQGLATAKAIRCTFALQANGTWKADKPAADVKAATLVLRFDSIDTDAGTAQLRNGSVGTEVTVRLAEGYLHFMQAFRTGPLYTTSVFGSVKTATGRFRAVHSRHELFAVPLAGATSSPEQYYGECEVAP